MGTKLNLRITSDVVFRIELVTIIVFIVVSMMVKTQANLCCVGLDVGWNPSLDFTLHFHSAVA